jgi:hypothetical protein
VSKRAALGVLTLAGLVLAGAGLWFLSHLGLSGSASFSAKPSSNRIVVLDPSVLNRVDSPVTITARARDGGEVWIGRATPSDAASLVGKAAATSITGVSVGGWQLETAQRGSGTAPGLSSADLWRQQAAGTGSATVTLQQENAPETVVVATASGKPADLTELTVQWERQVWSLEAIAALVLGLLLAAAGVFGLVRTRTGAQPAPRTPARRTPDGRTPAPDAETAVQTEQTIPLPLDRPSPAPTGATTSEEGRR